MKVYLNDGYKAQVVQCDPKAKKCDKSSGKVLNGKWSTIYDQALKIETDSGTRYVANFRYNVKPSTSSDPLKDN